MRSEVRRKRWAKGGAVIGGAFALAVGFTLAVPASAAGWQGFSLFEAPSRVQNGQSPAWAGALTTDLGGAGADIWTNNHHFDSEALIDVTSGNRSSIVTASGYGAVASIDTHGVSFTDLDGDGDEDLVEVMGRNNTNRIFRNDGGTLVPIPVGVLGDTDGRGRQQLPVDFDGDGDMDLVVTNLDLRVAPVNAATNSPSAVYLNNGRGTAWTVASNPSGALSEGSLRIAQLTSTGPGTDQIVITHNSFTVATDSVATGSAVIRDAATSATTRRTSHFRDAVIGDFDGDLHPEIVIARGDASATAGRFPMQIFDLVEGDSPVAVPQLAVGPRLDNCRSVAAGDFDNDGDLDIFGGCSHLQDGQRQNVVLLNDGRGNFTVGPLSLLPATGAVTAAGLAVGDLNADGALDVWVGNGNDFEQAVDLIALNDGGAGNYLTIDLQGSNPDAAGAQVFVGADGWQVRETGHRIRRGQDARALHFGLGTATRVAPVQIQWPDGTFASCTVSGINRTVTITQGASNCTARTEAQVLATIGAATNVPAPAPTPPATPAPPVAPNDNTGPVVRALKPASGSVMSPRAAAVFGGVSDASGTERVRVRVRRNDGGNLTYWNGRTWQANPAWVDATINPTGRSWIVRGVDFSQTGFYRVYTLGDDAAGNRSSAAQNPQLSFTVR